MTGETKVLVTKHSATRCRPWEESNDHMCPIDRDHSGIVKFRDYDSNYDTVLAKLQEMVARAATAERCMPQQGATDHATSSIPGVRSDTRKASSTGRKRPSSCTSAQLSLGTKKSKPTRN